MSESKTDSNKRSWVSQVNKKGAFKRRDALFRNHLGSQAHPAESGRYALFISHACPWANRTMILRGLKGLEKHIDFCVVDPLLGEGGWHFSKEFPDTICGGKKFMREIYLETDPDYNLNVTVPVLYDKKSKKIVNNESSEIIRMLNTAFNDVLKAEGNDKAASLDLYPEDLRDEIEKVNAWVYPQINNGVYKCGFARSQEAYDEAFDSLFAGLQKANDILAKRRYLAGDRLTEADVRMWTTLVRFAPVYAVHFKCNGKSIMEFEHVWAFTRELYQMPGVGSTYHNEHVKKHYYMSHESVNPFRIIAKGPMDYLALLQEPHGRDQSRL